MPSPDLVRPPLRAVSPSSPRMTALSVGLSVSLLWGCAGPEAGRGADSSSTLTVLYPSDERSLYPAADDVPLRLLFSPLVSYEGVAGADCREPVPGLAERWEHSDDWREWTIKLRQDLFWHDGTPLSAYDFAFTVRLWKHPQIQHWAGGAIDSVSLEDNLTFKIHYNKPSTDAINGWDVFYPEHLLKDLDPGGFWDWEFWSRPVGNGPFRYVRHIPGQVLELAANATHPLGKPEIGRLILKWGGGSPLAELQSRGVDAVEGMSGMDAAPLARLGYGVHYRSYPGGVRIFWNHRLPPFRDREVRTALTLAIDRTELHRVLGLPAGLPIDDGLHSPCQTARGEMPDPAPYDSAAAAELLSSAGWIDEDGDGVRERDGQPLSFTLDVPNAWLQAPRAATYVQERLARLGVEVEVRALELPVVGERFRSGDFEALIWITGPWPEHHLERFGGESWMGYENPRLAALLEEASETMERAAQDSLYEEISAIYRADMPATFLYPKVDVHVTTDRVLGYSPELGDLVLSLHRLAVAPSR